MARVLIVVQDSVWSKKTISIGSDSMVRLYKACIQSYFDCNGILTVKQRHINYYQDKLDKLQQRYLKNCLPPNKRYNKQDIYVIYIYTRSLSGQPSVSFLMDLFWTFYFQMTLH